LKPLPLILKLLSVTGATLALMYCAITSLDLGGFQSSNFQAADVIRQRCPIHLIKPEWMKGGEQGEILLKWMDVESKARVATFCWFWLFGVCLLLSCYKHLRKDPSGCA
jgi:hypothetical protein